MNIEHRTLNVQHRIMNSVHYKITECINFTLRNLSALQDSVVFKSSLQRDSLVLKTIKRSVINIRRSMLDVQCSTFNLFIVSARRNFIQGKVGVSGVRFRPALVRYDGFSLFAAKDPNIVLSSRFIQGSVWARGVRTGEGVRFRVSGVRTDGGFSAQLNRHWSWIHHR
jgi:hypothetical protein